MTICRYMILIVVALAESAVAQTAGVDLATIHTALGDEHSGPLVQLTESTLAIGGGEPTRFDISELLSLRFVGHKPSAARGSAMVIAANGDRLFVQIQEMDDEKMTALWQRFPAWPSVQIPLERIGAVTFNLPENAVQRGRLLATLLDYHEKSDAVFLKNGDRVNGELVMISPDALVIEGSVGKLSIPRGNVRAVGFNRELLSFPKFSGKGALLELTDGTRLTAGRVVMQEPGLLAVDCLFGAELELPLSTVMSIRFLGGRAEYLSDLKPSDFRFTPFLKMRWPLRLDRSVLGGPLRLDGREYAKGLGMHSHSRVSYNLAGKYRQFGTTIGIDDSARGGGSVRFAVEVDGEPVFVSELMTGKSKPVSIRPIDVTGKQELTLIIDFGQLGDILDHADWCDPVLIR